MEAKIKACTTPHALTHILTGIGIGLLLVGLFSSLAVQAVTLGIIVVIAGIVIDFTVNKG
ncbi:hypothetical protein A3B51_02330 [Candidatus Curtissbacteria bacterium RIFCSPLOWO2_01_FULL_41_18]|uniref:Uncharacterized protein n=2 Tax=Candidatus Curtissiibacteriota TaxID=1752717 RepID=A0A1F5FY44_9BACT|nr:MAG: hypothetical protein A2696_02045 [Candidatus Curtissbacteria bacterium RIFCSPHIGHO2_01_FULL_41_13]OGE04401.1 MAG: hypothetical protein A3B51_02330 [Candidatus Curtissbacteria bacterium RIFCSPLOWO2_01_FULL_41_18]